MLAARHDLHELVDRLPDNEIVVAKRFLEFLAQETVGPQFAESIRRGLEQASRGEVIECQSYDEMVKKLLGPE